MSISRIRPVCTFAKFLALVVLGLNVCPAAAGDRPHILLIISDDAGYADFGFQGSPEMPTPRLDKLAREGVRFGQAYVTASVCSPSRAGLLTGRYQQRFGHHHNLAGPGLPLDEKTIADHLGAAGYRSAAIGKWHLGSGPGYEPTARGFDTSVGLLGGSRSYWAQDNPNRQHALRIDNGEPIKEAFEYLTPWLAEQTNAFYREHVERHPDTPSFVYLALTAPHTPMHAPEEYLQSFDHIDNARRRTYLAMQAAMDDAIGSILDTLDELEIADNTIVVFVNDNGGATDNGSDNGLLRGMKGSEWEGGLRVPMVIRWPGVAPEWTTYAHPVMTFDLLPTFLAAAGAEPIAGSAPLDGVDLRPFITRQADAKPHETLFWSRSFVHVVRHGDWKLIRVADVRTLLFDLAADPGETVNLYEARPQIAEDLDARLDAWLGELAEPLWYEGEPWETNTRNKHRMEVRGRDAERRIP